MKRITGILIFGTSLLLAGLFYVQTNIKPLSDGWFPTLVIAGMAAAFSLNRRAPKVAVQLLLAAVLVGWCHRVWFNLIV